MLLKLDQATPPFPVDENIGLNDFEHLIHAQAEEIVGVFESDRLILQPKRGWADGVGFIDAEVPHLRDRVVTHNHPLGGPPSAADAFVAVEANLAQLRAVSPDGTVYVLLRPQKGWPSSDIMVEVAERSIDALRKENTARLSAGRPLLSPREENGLFYRERRIAFAELGVTLEKTDLWHTA